MNLGLDIFFAGITLRVGIAIIVGHIETIRHIGGGLFNDAQTLAHFVETHQVTGKAAAGRLGRYVEVKTIVTGVGHLFAQIPVDAARTQVGSGHTPVNRFVEGGNTNAFGARPEDRAIGEHAIKFINALVKVAGKNIDIVFPAIRQVHRQPADTEPGRMHTPTGYLLDDIENLFA